LDTNRPHRFDKDGKCFRTGNKAEARFDRMAKQRGAEVVSATKYENCRKHIDRKLVYPHKTVCVSIKAMKKAHRSHSAAADTLFLIEIHGKKTKGWLYDSIADVIAQEIPGGFILLYRDQVIRYVEDIVLPSYETLEPQKSSPKNCPGHVYNRVDQDAFIFVEIPHMLKYIDHTRWIEPESNLTTQ
jgi:hypothetical protein